MRQKNTTARPTRKQQEVLQLLANDYKIPEIAVELGATYRAIEKRIERCKIKLGKRTAAGLVAYAIVKGFIQLLSK